jgi:hypothetical protein
MTDFTKAAHTPSGTVIQGPTSGIDSKPNSYDLQQNGKDDITNHGLQTSVGGG